MWVLPDEGVAVGMGLTFYFALFVVITVVARARDPKRTPGPDPEKVGKLFD